MALGVGDGVADADDGFVLAPVVLPLPGVGVGVELVELVGDTDDGLSVEFGFDDSVLEGDEDPPALPASVVFSGLAEGVGVAFGVGVGSLPCALSAACSFWNSG